MPSSEQLLFSVNHSIEEGLTNLAGALWTGFKPVFLFINRDCSIAQLGVGHSKNLTANIPTFIASRFEDNEPSVLMKPKVLIKTSKSMWPHAQLIVSESGSETEGITVYIKDLLTNSDLLYDNVPLCKGIGTETGISREAYEAAVHTAKALMDEGLNKIVLSRKVTYSMMGIVNPLDLLLRIITRTSRTDSGKRYIVAYASADPNEGSFISLTPERLCYVSNNALETEALAGTCSGSEFEMTDKLDEEHSLVSNFLKATLGSIAEPTELWGTDRDYIKLRDLVHCRQKFSVKAASLNGIELIKWAIAHLHPTPAVGSLPRSDSTLKLIRQFEGQDRNFFAGPMGVFDPTDGTGELCVAIRSARISGKQIDVFAGAGIVKDSDAQSEWDEMELKMSQFRSALVGPTNPTEAECMLAINELVRQDVTHFIICPGSRSTPLTRAVRMSKAHPENVIVVHDERCAGFYAVGAARAGGLPAIIVTSGTAVANLMPAVCEAREAGLALILLTADRPSRSWNVGEYQTVPQVGMFRNYVVYEKNFPVPTSGTVFQSIVSDISFAVGNIAKQRHQSVHLNFEFEKAELQPTAGQEGLVFAKSFWDNIPPRLEQYLRSTKVYTEFLSGFAGMMSIPIPESILEPIVSGKALVVAGQLRFAEEAVALKKFCNNHSVACIAEPLSMITVGDKDKHILTTIDQVIGDDRVRSALSTETELIIRVGGPLISGRLQEWASTIRTVRVFDDMFSTTRHDPQYAAEMYVHAGLKSFLESLEHSLKDKTAKNEPAHIVSRIAEKISAFYTQAINTVASSQWSEAIIAKIVSTVANDTDAAVVLSASMPCRDFAIFGSSSSDNPYRDVTANRGANGIDGVISTAVGYASYTGTVTYVLIGDVATLHDLSGLALALNVHPGAQENKFLSADVRIVCVNNAGGAIFSFLPISKHTDVFNPYFDTPHSMRFAPIADNMKRGCAVEVTDSVALEAALRDDSKKFIECIGLPTHEDNVNIHKQIGSIVGDLIVSEILDKKLS